MPRAHLKEHGIATRIISGSTSNVCCMARYVRVVKPEQFDLAEELATAWMKDHHWETHLICDAKGNVPPVKSKAQLKQEAEASKLATWLENTAKG
jgi:hypothetical protein